VIVLDNLAIGGTPPILERVSCTFPAGAVSAIVAPRGAGKTALLLATLGLIPADAGTVSVDGVEPRHDPLAARRRMCFVPSQAPAAPGLSVLGAARAIAGLASGELPPASDATHALRLSEIPDRLMAGPAAALGSFHRLCVWLGVHRLRKTPILLMDDPTAHLNAQEIAAFGRLVRETLDAGRCVVFTARDLELSRAAEAEAVFRIDARTLRPTSSDRPPDPERPS
jgi:ABC-2 type transport system ATP-binding protein